MSAESKRWVKNAEGSYQDRKGCLYVAAKGGRLKKRVTYLQLNPGNGKSFIALMIYKYIVTKLQKEAVLVVIN